MNSNPTFDPATGVLAFSVTVAGKVVDSFAGLLV